MLSSGTDEKKRVRLSINRDGYFKISETENIRKSGPVKPGNTVFLFGNIGLGIAVPLFIGAIGGNRLDSHFGTHPTITLAGIAIGFVISIANLFIAFKEFIYKNRKA